MQYWPKMHWASALQLTGQLAAEPLQTYGAHIGLPNEPAGTLVHIPTAPGRLQASQAPLQAVLQQTPSTHWPVPRLLGSERPSRSTRCSK